MMLDRDLRQPEDWSFEPEESDDNAASGTLSLDYPLSQLNVEITRAWKDGEELLLEEVPDELDSFIARLLIISEDEVWLDLRSNERMFVNCISTEKELGLEIIYS